MMEFQEMRKILENTKNRYERPHAEAMKLRLLWTYDKAPNRAKDVQVAKDLYKEAKTRWQDDRNNASGVLVILTIGLKCDPRSHPLYALRGDIYMNKGELNRAVRNYVTARTMVKFDKKIPEAQVRRLYTKQLVDTYWLRGQFYEKNGQLIEAIADYEQVLELGASTLQRIEVQDTLLAALRTLDKYDAFRRNWLDFMDEATPKRSSVLLTQHADYKIQRTEMAEARRILFEAIDLDHDNLAAQELLQVVFDTGHTMVAYAIIWCIHGCYDKALITIEKGTDCDPYNPGYTLLKAIVLRISGRLFEAVRWLENVNRGFFKLLQPSRDKQGSIMGTLTIEETRSQLVKQWYLIRYDLAVKHMLEGNYQEAFKLLQNSRLTEKYAETYLLLGDCMMNQGKPALALQMYLKCHQKSLEMGCWEKSAKKIGLVQRLADILNSQARQATQQKRTRSAMSYSGTLLKCFQEQKINLAHLGAQRGEALMHKSRCCYQTSILAPSCSCYWTVADSLCFTRGIDDGGLYGAVLGEEMPLENVIGSFASEKKLPYCAKLLM